MKFLSAFLLPIALATSALAHGYVSQINIDGTVYQGNVPNATPQDSIIRQIDTTSPVKGASNKDLNCGPGAGPATSVANAMPGSNLQFYWNSGDGNWPHDTGPLMTYMASCGSETCDKFDSTTAKWFKIDQQGLEVSDSQNEIWFQANVHQGAPVNVTIPNTLAPGNYMIRHEIIALHLAETLGGAEFYPSCSQFSIGGSQTGAPTSSELVSFPGGYSDTDPGILDPGVYNSGASYTFPGPNVAAFIGGSPSSSSNTGGSSATSSSTKASGTAHATASGTATTANPTSTSSTSPKSTGTCKLKKRSTTSSAASLTARTVRPRHISRIMRGLIANIKRS